MKLAALFAAATLCLASASTFAEEAVKATTQPAAKPVNTLCPVSGEKVDAKYTVIQDGKVVGFCCEDCPAEFKKDPQKYMKNLK